MTLHLDIGGSNVDRLLQCNQWREESKSVPSRPPGEAAITGSMHHLIQETAQRDDMKPADLLGTVYREGPVSREFTDDDLVLSEIAYAMTNKALAEYNITEFLVEPFVQLVKGKVGGSIDLLGVSEDRKTVLVVDYKFGRYPCVVERSSQHMLYALSAQADKLTAAMFSDCEHIVFVIIQPQVSSVPLVWEAPNKEIADFEARLRVAMQGNSLKAGPACRFCPAAPYCSVRRDSLTATKALGTDKIKNLQAASDMIDEVKAWLTAVEEEVFLQLNRGVSIDGKKIVDKAARRSWVNQDAAQAELLKGGGLTLADVTKTSLKTPAQIEKIARKAELDIDLRPLVVSVSSGTTLANSSDKRPGISAAPTTGLLADLMK